MLLQSKHNFECGFNCLLDDRCSLHTVYWYCVLLIFQMYHVLKFIYTLYTHSFYILIIYFDLTEMKENFRLYISIIKGFIHVKSGAVCPQVQLCVKFR